MESKSRKLRSGYTTGACAAAAAKAATLILMRNAECGMRNEGKVDTAEIPFPDGSRNRFIVHHSELRTLNSELSASASVIKDAGDDPDVTHGAEIEARVAVIAECGWPIERATLMRNAENSEIIIKGGKGVGVVTKPGLAVPVGEAAINPVPRKMIRDAVMEAIEACRTKIPHSAFRIPNLEVTISVPSGEKLAKKTLNSRLGIVGGISILGTTGIVRPVSADAWTATITASMDVARAAGLGTIVLSSGRTSEKAHMKVFRFPEESYAMMGDYLEFSLRAAKRHGFREVHLCAQWAKMLKAAMGTPQTHVRHGALEAKEAADFLMHLGIDLPREKAFNTSREIYEVIRSECSTEPALECSRRGHSAFKMVCSAAKRYAEEITSGIPVIAHLVSYEGDILAASE